MWSFITMVYGAACSLKTELDKKKRMKDHRLHGMCSNSTLCQNKNLQLVCMYFIIIRWWDVYMPCTNIYRSTCCAFESDGILLIHDKCENSTTFDLIELNYSCGVIHFVDANRNDARRPTSNVHIPASGLVFSRNHNWLVNSFHHTVFKNLIGERFLSTILLFSNSHPAIHENARVEISVKVLVSSFSFVRRVLREQIWIRRHRSVRIEKVK